MDRKLTMRRLRTSTLIVTSALTAGANAQDYVFTAGDNVVNMSGSRCVTGRVSDQASFTHSAGNTTVKTSAGTMTLFCPITRRSTSWMGITSNTTTNATDVYPAAVVARVTDASDVNTVSCKLFLKGIAGSVSYSVTRYACSASTDGCDTTGLDSWTGTNDLAFFNPFGRQSTLNWGLTCVIPRLSSIHHYKTFVILN